MIAKCLSCEYAIDTVNDGRICKLFGNQCKDVIACQSSDEFKPKPQTNADRIRSMSDEELAEFAVSTGQGCAPGENLVECCFDHKDGPIEADCRKCWIDWLREDVTDV